MVALNFWPDRGTTSNTPGSEWDAWATAWWETDDRPTGTVTTSTTERWSPIDPDSLKSTPPGTRPPPALIQPWYPRWELLGTDGIGLPWRRHREPGLGLRNFHKEN